MFLSKFCSLGFWGGLLSEVLLLVRAPGGLVLSGSSHLPFLEGGPWRQQQGDCCWRGSFSWQVLLTRRQPACGERSCPAEWEATAGNLSHACRSPHCTLGTWVELVVNTEPTQKGAVDLGHPISPHVPQLLVMWASAASTCPASPPPFPITVLLVFLGGSDLPPATSQI